MRRPYYPRLGKAGVAAADGARGETAIPRSFNASQRKSSTPRLLRRETIVERHGADFDENFTAFRVGAIRKVISPIF